MEACGISRQTFYYHFQDILEVIEWSLDQAFSHLLEQSLAADRARSRPARLSRDVGGVGGAAAEAPPLAKARAGRAAPRPLRAHLLKRGDRAQRPRAGALVRGHGHGAQLLYIRGSWGCCSRAARKRAPTAPAAHGRCTICSRAASGRTGRSPSNNSIPSGGQFAYLQSAPSVRTDPQECQKF